jgi:hypothetical protein
MSDEEYVPVTPRLLRIVPADMVTERDLGPPGGANAWLSSRPSVSP